MASFVYILPLTEYKLSCIHNLVLQYYAVGNVYVTSLSRTNYNVTVNSTGPLF